jgi:hypothetical protein
MAIVPNDTRFIGINPTVNLRERRSARINRETQPVSMQDITDSIRPYKVFTAIVTLWDNDSPGVIELENTIGAITFSKVPETTGKYNIESDSLFTEYKTILFYGSIGREDSPESGLQLISNWQSTVRITLDTYKDGTESNLVIWETPIEIRVYN